jgi:5-formyltetrahydrofolate cyclo-ligase
VSTPPGSDKTRLRRAVRESLRAMTTDQRAAASRVIAKALLALDAWRDATCVLLYHALPDEPDLTEAVEAGLAAGKRILLPRTSGPSAAGAMEAAPIEVADRERLAKDPLGIPAPVSPAVEAGSIDLAVVPGVAFDPTGGRLGRGGGFYDRYLARLRASCGRIGVCFDRQVVAALPRESHDERVDRVLTEQRHLPPELDTKTPTGR